MEKENTDNNWNAPLALITRFLCAFPTPQKVRALRCELKARGGHGESVPAAGVEAQAGAEISAPGKCPHIHRAHHHPLLSPLTRSHLVRRRSVVCPFYSPPLSLFAIRSKK